MRTILLIGFGGAILLIGGVVFFGVSRSEYEGSPAPSAEEQTVTQHSTTTDAVLESALQGVGSIACDIDLTNGVEVRVQILNGRVRARTEVQNVPTDILVIEDDVYVWQEGKTAGFHLNLADTEASWIERFAAGTKESYLALLQSQHEGCTQQVVAVEDVSVPVDVEFSPVSGN